MIMLNHVIDDHFKCVKRINLNPEYSI